MDKEKVIQIIPAPKGVYSRRHDEYDHFHERIVCIGLTQWGNVVFMGTDIHGEILPVNRNDDIVFLDEPPEDII